jgi:hypothetical protein
MLIISGDAGPLACGGQLVELLAQRYRDAEVQDVTLRLFTEARHEIFNETNRDEVTRYFVEWLNARGSSPPPVVQSEAVPHDCVLLSTLPKPSGDHTPHHRWATSITSRCPAPGPASRKARIGNWARTPSPIVV